MFLHGCVDLDSDVYYRVKSVPYVENQTQCCTFNTVRTQLLLEHSFMPKTGKRVRRPEHICRALSLDSIPSRKEHLDIPSSRRHNLIADFMTKNTITSNTLRKRTLTRTLKINRETVLIEIYTLFERDTVKPKARNRGFLARVLRRLPPSCNSRSKR